MNLALSALTILFVALPGYALIRAYHGRFGLKSPVTAVPPGVTTTWLLGLVFAPFVHAFTIFLIGWLSPNSPTPSLENVFFFMAGNYSDSKAYMAAVTSITDVPGILLMYFVLVNVIAVLAGDSARRIVRGLKLDVHNPRLRFPDRWHYIFSGELFDPARKPETVMVTVTVNATNESMLYLGFLRRYHTDQNGDLIRLEFQSVWRRKLSNDRDDGEQQVTVQASSRFYEITGDFFVVWCEDIETLNIRYVYADSDTTED